MESEGSESDEAFIEDIIEFTKKSCVEWCNLIRKMGLDEDTLLKWRSTFMGSLKDVHQDLLVHAGEVEKKLIDTIEQLLKKADEFCKILNLKLPPYGSEDLSLFEEKKHLQSKVDQYENIINARRKTLSGVNKRLQEVCQALGIEPRLIPENPLPNEDDIADVLKKIDSLETEKFSREEKYLHLKGEILEIANELGVIPSLSLEKIVFSEDDLTFLVTDINMKWLEEYHRSILNQQERTKLEIIQVREKLQNLWGLLQEDIKTRSEFLEKHACNSLETLEALNLELKRCQDLKKLNIQKFINNLRVQIETLWTKCHFSVEQQGMFEYFHDTCYTEDLLMLHDMEINKLNKYYNDNKELLCLLEKREQLWTRMKNLEECTLAPDRFKNRGGQLLKEEKNRNILQKRIPELEEKIFELAKEHEDRTGIPFTSRGCTVHDIIAKTYEIYNDEKKQKMSARKHLQELTVTPSKPGPSSMVLSSQKTLMIPSTSKRKPMTALFSSAKRMKDQGTDGMLSSRQNILKNPCTPSARTLKPRTALFSNSKATAPKTAPVKLQVNNKTIVRRYSRHSYEYKKKGDKLKRLSKKLQKKKAPPSSTTADTTYKVFEMEISSKQTCRSTRHLDPCSSGFLAVPLPETPRTPKTPNSVSKFNNNILKAKSKLKLKPRGQLKLDF